MSKRMVMASCILLFMSFLSISGAPVQAASSWHYYVTGPGGSNEIPADNIGQIVYFQFDATVADYVWGNVRIEFDPSLLECVSIEESPDTYGFWTAWVPQTADPAYGGGGLLYYYDSTGFGSGWARSWVDMLGPLQGGPSGSYDNTLGIIRLYAMTGAGGLNGSLPLRIGFRIKQAGTAVFTTYANDGTAFTWRTEDLPFSNTSVVQIGMQACIQPPSGMVSWWPGDGNANDIIGGHNGTMQNGVTFVDGKVGQAFEFNGTDGSIRISHNEDLNPDGTFGLDAWIKADPQQYSYDGLFVVIDKSHGFIDTTGWVLQGVTRDDESCRITLSRPCIYGEMAFVIGNGISFADSGVGTMISVLDNKWHHIAGVYTGNELRIYLDGELKESRSYANMPSNNTRDVYIGRHGLYPVRHFHGLIDEVEIFNRALTAEEIRAIYLAGSAGKCKNLTPTANAGPDQTIETTSCAGAVATLDGSGSSDPDGDALTYTWTENGTVIANGVKPAVTLSYGSHSITLTVDDGKGGTATDEVKIDVVDTTAPALNVSLNPNVLWPPNHKMVSVSPTVTFSDACNETTTVSLISKTSNEPDNGLGDGDTVDDIVVNTDGTISLRAERSGKGSGRVYTFTYWAKDLAGNVKVVTATAVCPHDIGKK